MTDASLVNSCLHCHLCTRAEDPDWDTRAFRTERSWKTPPHPNARQTALGPTFRLGGWRCRPPPSHGEEREGRHAELRVGGGGGAGGWLPGGESDAPPSELCSRRAGPRPLGGHGHALTTWRAREGKAGLASVKQKHILGEQQQKTTNGNRKAQHS